MNISVVSRVWVVALALAFCGCGGTAPVAPSTAPALLNDPTGIAFDSAGNLWVANYRGDSLLMYRLQDLSRGGRLTPAVSITGDPTMLRGPNRLAFDRAGRLWVADYDTDSITAYAPAALARGGPVAPEAVIKSEGIGQPTGLAFDAAGNLWVTNQRSGNVISIAAADLARTGSPPVAISLAMPGGRASIPEALEFDAGGTLWVALFGSNRIVGFRPSSLSVSGSPSPAAALAADSPIGLTIDASGHIWVAEAAALRNLDSAHPAASVRTVSWNAMPHPHTAAVDRAGNLWFSCQDNTVAMVSESQLESGDAHAPKAVISSRAA